MISPNMKEELVILSLLHKGDSYAHELTELIKEKSGGDYAIRENIVALLLSSLCGSKYLTLRRWNRRNYYHLEERGKIYYKEILNIYQTAARGIDKIISAEE